MLVVRAAAAAVLLGAVCHIINTESAAMYCRAMSTNLHNFASMATNYFSIIRSWLFINIAVSFLLILIALAKSQAIAFL
jgi:hypothetical protein